MKNPTTINRVQFVVVEGENIGDSIGLEKGACRLIGRHLGENETAVLTLEGARMLDVQEVKLFEPHLEESEHHEPRSLSAFKRGADMVFSDEAVSRAHAMLFFDENSGVGVVDLASTNGTFVNGKNTAVGVLKKGDRIRCGCTVLELG